MTPGAHWQSPRLRAPQVMVIKNLPQSLGQPCPLGVAGAVLCPAWPTRSTAVSSWLFWQNCREPNPCPPVFVKIMKSDSRGGPVLSLLGCFCAAPQKSTSGNGRLGCHVVVVASGMNEDCKIHACGEYIQVSHEAQSEPDFKYESSGCLKGCEKPV